MLVHTGEQADKEEVGYAASVSYRQEEIKLTNKQDTTWFWKLVLNVNEVVENYKILLTWMIQNSWGLKINLSPPTESDVT